MVSTTSRNRLLDLPPTVATRLQTLVNEIEGEKMQPGVTAIKPPGLGSLEARAYLLLSAAHDDAENYGWEPAKCERARRLWKRFIAAHPQFRSPIVTR